MGRLSEQLAKAAFEIKAIKLNPSDPFTWVSGYRMPIYNDNRLLLGSSLHRSLVADGFIELIESNKITFDIIAGTATAGIPFATTLADRMKTPLVYVRKEPKGYGMGKRVEGALGNGKRVLLIEDLISTGGSSISALQAIRNEGGIVENCLSIFHYEFPEAIESFANIGVTQIPILKFSELLKIAKNDGKISQKEYDVLCTWSGAPFMWGANNGFPKVEK